MLQQFNEKNRDLIVNINGRLCIAKKPASVRSIPRSKAATPFGKGFDFITAASSNYRNISIACSVPPPRLPSPKFRLTKK